MIDADLIDDRKIDDLIVEISKLCGYDASKWTYRFVSAGAAGSPYRTHDAIAFTYDGRPELFFYEIVDLFRRDALPDLANLACPPNSIKLAPAPGDPLPPLSRKPETQIDVLVQNEGSIVLFHALTDEAEQFFAEHFEHAQHFGRAVVVEHCYANDLFNFLEEAGLRVI